MAASVVAAGVEFQLEGEEAKALTDADYFDGPIDKKTGKPAGTGKGKCVALQRRSPRRRPQSEARLVMGRARGAEKEAHRWRRCAAEKQTPDEERDAAQGHLRQHDHS